MGWGGDRDRAEGGVTGGSGSTQCGLLVLDAVPSDSSHTSPFLGLAAAKRLAYV